MDIRDQIVQNERIIEKLNLELAKKSGEVRIIQEISSEINSTLDLDSLFGIILGSMDRILGFQHSMILLQDESEEKLRVFASRGYEQGGIGAEVQLGQGVIGVVAKRKKMVRIGNIGSSVSYFAAVRTKMEEAGQLDSAQVPVKLPGLPNVQSQLAIPLLVKERLIGVLAVESPKTNAFDELDEILPNIVANQTATAIDNARMYQTEERRVKELNEAHTKLVRLNESLEQMVRERTAQIERANADLSAAFERLEAQAAQLSAPSASRGAGTTAPSAPSPTSPPASAGRPSPARSWSLSACWGWWKIWWRWRPWASLRLRGSSGLCPPSTR